MTLTATSATDDTVVLPTIQAAPPRPAEPPSTARRITVRLGWTATLLAALLLGFAVFLLALSPLQELHYQAEAYRTFQDRLANQLGPTGAATDGSPVAIIDIPRIGVHHEVVVEGTTGRDLMRGPGHRRDTALPGQAGVAVIFGRGTAFGGPFGRLGELRVGDKIQVTTGQGQFSFTVNVYGNSTHPVRDPAPSRLVLTTSNSGWIPTGTVLIGARLDGDPQANPHGRPAQLPADHALAQDSGALAALQLWSVALLGAVALATLAVRYWVRRAAYLTFAPVLAALLWSVYENAAALLPNLY
ncbi:MULTISPECIES: sortase [Kitasatospora]|uniref:sortase n=1 Tax=Kitasatospora TaxID=2063 RepID=UPI000C705498|nr:sortase [Kitasatospora sp. GP30]MDH6141485.1 sortase A [Kitasatospora sp. GP30]